MGINQWRSRADFLPAPRMLMHSFRSCVMSSVSKLMASLMLFGSGLRCDGTPTVRLEHAYRESVSFFIVMAAHRT